MAVNRDRHSDQPWLQQTASTRQQDQQFSWMLGFFFLLPLLAGGEGWDLIIVLYIVEGLIGLLFVGMFKVQRRSLKYCPECKTPNPVDANLCGRCGVIPAKGETATCASL